MPCGGRGRAVNGPVTEPQIPGLLPIAVVTAGGDELRVGLIARGTGPGARWDVSLTGPAEVAYRGEWLEADAVAAVRA